MFQTTMLSQIHLSETRLQILSDAKSHKTYEKVTNDLRNGKKARVSYPCFVEIQKLIQDEFKKDTVTIFIEKKDITLLDVVNTFAYLQSSVREKNILFMEPRSLFNWSAVNDSTNQYIKVKMPKSDLQKIQYGWGCYIDTHHATRKHFQSLAYYRIASTWSTDDETVFRHVLVAFYEMIGRSKKSYVVPDIDQKSLGLIKKLPLMLEKFGITNEKYPWEPYFLQDYLNPDNFFLKSLMAFIIPWKSCAGKSISISADKFAIEMFKETANAPPVLKEFSMICAKHMNSAGRYIISSGEKSIYEEFYNFLLSDMVTPENAFKLFLSIQYEGCTRYTGCKRRGGNHTNSTLYDFKLNSVEQYFIGKQVDPYKYPSINGKCHLARLLLLCEMRSEYKRDKWASFTPKEYVENFDKSSIWCFVEDILAKDANVDHLVSLSKESRKKDDQDGNVPISLTFPVLKFSKAVNEKLKKVNVNNYYN